MLVDLCFVAVALATTAAAQQPVWAQCGGIGWSGATTCATGTACTVLNAYYSQCIPVIATTSAQTSSPSVTSSSPTGTPSSVSPAHPMHPTSYWFSFGDSYTQTDFDINGTLPTLDNPMGNPPYPGYTAVGGTNWIDLNTVEYNRSIILTYNFAYGGATIDASLVAPYEPTVLSLTDQVNEFLSTVASQPDYAPWNPTIALFSFWIGINDIGNSYYESGDRDAFSDTLLDAYFALVQKIYITSDVGGRNFLFINVPPVDRSPLMLAQAVSAQALEKTVIAGFNSKLAARVTSLAASNTGVQTWLWDSNTAFTTVLNDPTAYGFVDAISYGNTGDFWGNNYHPSSAAQTLWAQDIAALFNGTFW